LSDTYFRDGIIFILSNDLKNQQSCWIYWPKIFFVFLWSHIYYGWPYARHAWYKRFNSNEILSNSNLIYLICKVKEQ